MNNDEEMKFLWGRMDAIRHMAMMLFGALLCVCVAMEFAEAMQTLQGDEVVHVFDAESEESEEGQEEEREGPEEKKDKQAEYEAFLHADRHRMSADCQRLHQIPPCSGWSALVDAKIWEPPEQG